jgi:transposase-like protein
MVLEQAFWPQPAAGMILHRFAAGSPVQNIAQELGLDPDVVRDALRDAARRHGTSDRLASVLELVAAGKTMREVANELGISEDDVKTELRATDHLTGGIAGALMARSALPRAPIQLGAAPQGPLRTMPVRFPERQYQRLKNWSETNDFPMAVVVRGLVERFLDEQERSGG